MKEYHKIETAYKRDPENRCKTLLEGQYSTPEFQYLANTEWVWTEKIDGTNIRIEYDGQAYSFGGKTVDSQISTVLYKKLQEIFTIEKLETNFAGGGVCLYGEGFGAKIQKHGDNYIKNECGFILFDVKCGDWWLKRKDIEDVANKIGIPVVPIIGYGTLPEAVEKTREGFNSVYGDFIAEGIVMKPAIELFDRSGKRIISKIKHKDFPKQ